MYEGFGTPYKCVWSLEMKFREYRSLLFLSAASFSAGLAIGYVKFFLLGHLADHEHAPSDKAWIIQAVGALITLGPCLTFVVGGPLASAYLKSRVMSSAGVAAALVMAFGAMTHWLGSGWAYVFLAGLGLGLFNAARNSAVPLEASRENISTEFVNACVNNTYIVGLLLGVPIGTQLYLVSPSAGAWVTSALFLVCAAFGQGSRIDREEDHLRDFRESLTQLSTHCRALFREFRYYLLAAPMLWGIAGALSLAATAFVEECGFAGALAASLMSVYAAFGVVAGNFFSTKLQASRYSAAMLSSAGLGIAIALIPLVGLFNQSLNGVEHLGYVIVSLLLLLCGLSFGIATNLLEAEYLQRIYVEKLEGTGAALLSACTSLWCFLLGGSAAIAVLSGVLTSSSQFVALAAFTCIVCALIAKLAKAPKITSPT